MPDPPPASHPTLLATYTSPTTSKIFSHPLSAPAPLPHQSSSPPRTAVKAKTAYLSELRASTKQLQEEINGYLTGKMKEDKASAAADAKKEKKGGEKARSEEDEEERYGEEEVGAEGG